MIYLILLQMLSPLVKLEKSSYIPQQYLVSDSSIYVVVNFDAPTIEARMLIGGRDTTLYIEYHDTVEVKLRDSTTYVLLISQPVDFPQQTMYAESVILRMLDSASQTNNGGGLNLGWPVDLYLNGSAPREKTAYLDLWQIPPDAIEVTLSFEVFDADFENEGELWVNDNGPIVLFGSQGVHDSLTAVIDFPTPVSWWLADTLNALRFVHNYTWGYRVNRAMVSFLTGFGVSDTVYMYYPIEDVDTLYPAQGNEWAKETILIRRKE